MAHFSNPVFVLYDIINPCDNTMYVLETKGLYHLQMRKCGFKTLSGWTPAALSSRWTFRICTKVFIDRFSILSVHYGDAFPLLTINSWFYKMFTALECPSPGAGGGIYVVACILPTDLVERQTLNHTYCSPAPPSGAQGSDESRRLSSDADLRRTGGYGGCLRCCESVNKVTW